jgi:hypothetical protein
MRTLRVSQCQQGYAAFPIETASETARAFSESIEFRESAYRRSNIVEGASVGVAAGPQNISSSKR